MRGAATKLKAGFKLNVQKWTMPEPSDASLAKKPHLMLSLTIIRVAGGHLGCVSTSSTDSQKKGSHGG